jgi:hypothetical protein
MAACVDILLIGVNPCSPRKYRDAHSRTGAFTIMLLRRVGDGLERSRFSKTKKLDGMPDPIPDPLFRVGSYPSTCPINSSSGGMEYPAILDGFPLFFHQISTAHL